MTKTMIRPLDISTPSDREVLITRDFDAPVDLVFDCHTVPALVRRWLLGPPGWTMPVCDIDLRVGGRYRYVWRGPDGEEMGMGGVYREVARPYRIVVNELFDEDWTGGETTVTTRFSETGGITRSTVTVLYSSKQAREAAGRSGMADGMEAGYQRLDELLATTPAK
jgi:uncharacterized protein YndB with AHSA1/START domain